MSAPDIAVTAAGELYSLVRFLRVFPWAYYFCKARAHVGNRCDCNSLDHLFKKDRKRCDNCGCVPCSCKACLEVLAPNTHDSAPEPVHECLK